jgi:WS/DGAT/MGAT family acyltransferase
MNQTKSRRAKPQIVPLTGLDATFLHLESAETPMHVGGLHTFELPKAARPKFHRAVVKHLEQRLHLAPLFTRKLSFLPFDVSNPVWIDDHEVDLEMHVLRTKLPKPGSEQQLLSLVGELHARLLDRSRPLWEFHIIEGLESGEVALYTKVHHAAIDGQAGVALANAILDLTPVARAVKPREKPIAARDALGTAELLGATLAHQLQQTTRLLKLLPSASKTLGVQAISALGQTLKGSIKKDKNASGADAVSNWKLGPRTPLNVNISRERVFATARLDLERLKTCAKAHDASLNDIVLAVCSGALRRYLQVHRALPRTSLTAAVPVSLRASAEQAAGNQATMTLVELATDVADPAKRLRKILKNSAAMKQGVGKFKSLMPTDFPALGAPWWMSGLNKLYKSSRLAERLRPLANVVISNVPGPPMPLYLAGGKMLRYHPVSIVVHGIALNITLQSYNGSVDFGLIGCAQAVPDLDLVAHAIHECFIELEALSSKPKAKKPSSRSVKSS